MCPCIKSPIILRSILGHLLFGNSLIFEAVHISSMLVREVSQTGEEGFGRIASVCATVKRSGKPTRHGFHVMQRLQ